jgi:hypothetical protein
MNANELTTKLNAGIKLSPLEACIAFANKIAPISAQAALTELVELRARIEQLEKTSAAALGRKGGSVSSPAKTAAARANGKLSRKATNCPYCKGTGKETVVLAGSKIKVRCRFCSDTK